MKKKIFSPALFFCKSFLHLFGAVAFHLMCSFFRVLLHHRLLHHLGRRGLLCYRRRGQHSRELLHHRSRRGLLRCRFDPRRLSFGVHLGYKGRSRSTDRTDFIADVAQEEARALQEIHNMGVERGPWTGCVELRPGSGIETIGGTERNGAPAAPVGRGGKGTLAKTVERGFVVGFMFFFWNMNADKTHNADKIHFPFSNISKKKIYELRAQN